MGQRPSSRDESQAVTPAKAGVQVREELDPAPRLRGDKLRGNDVSFDGARNLALIVFNAVPDSSPVAAATSSE